MTQKQPQNMRSNGLPVTQPPHPEVVPQAQRRIFTARYKLWVLEEVDKCRDQPGQIGALLRLVHSIPGRRTYHTFSRSDRRPIVTSSNIVEKVSAMPNQIMEP